MTPNRFAYLLDTDTFDQAHLETYEERFSAFLAEEYPAADPVRAFCKPSTGDPARDGLD